MREHFLDVALFVFVCLALVALFAMAVENSNDRQAASCEAKGGAAVQTINGGTACVAVIK